MPHGVPCDRNRRIPLGRGDLRRRHAPPFSRPRPSASLHRGARARFRGRLSDVPAFTCVFGKWPRLEHVDDLDWRVCLRTRACHRRPMLPQTTAWISSISERASAADGTDASCAPFAASAAGVQLQSMSSSHATLAATGPYSTWGGGPRCCPTAWNGRCVEEALSAAVRHGRQDSLYVATENRGVTAGRHVERVAADDARYVLDNRARKGGRFFGFRTQNASRSCCKPVARP
jgi:hypothetical protein